ncbi:MAG: hypothetical protein ACLQMH_03950 [Solirubrobacteraceae bacterium]
MPDFGARPKAGISSPVVGFIVKRPRTVHCFPSQPTVALTGTSVPLLSGQLDVSLSTRPFGFAFCRTFFAGPIDFAATLDVGTLVRFLPVFRSTDFSAAS